MPISEFAVRYSLIPDGGRLAGANLWIERKTPEGATVGQRPEVGGREKDGFRCSPGGRRGAGRVAHGRCLSVDPVREVSRQKREFRQVLRAYVGGRGRGGLRGPHPTLAVPRLKSLIWADGSFAFGETDKPLGLSPRKTQALFGKSTTRGPAGPILLKTVHRTVFRALDAPWRKRGGRGGSQMPPLLSCGGDGGMRRQSRRNRRKRMLKIWHFGKLAKKISIGSSM